MGLEAALAEHEQRVDALLKLNSKYSAALKAWRRACETGDLARRAAMAAAAAELAPRLAAPTAETAQSWEFDVRAYLEAGDWRAELQAAAADLYGLRTLAEGDDLLVSSPVVVEAQPARGALKLGRDAFKTIRPRVVAAELKRLRDRTSAANSGAFLEGLFAAWQRLTDDARPVAAFKDIYELFACTPGWRKDNPRAAFAQAIYALHESGLRATRGGRSFELSTPSGNVREKDIFAVAAEDGQMRRYYGIRFR